MPPERSTEGSRVKLGRYELVKELAGTGVASSWIARLENDEAPSPRLFSILRLHKHVTKNVDAVEALLSEARRAQKIKDARALAVVETGVSDGEIFVVTEHVEAESLATLVQQSGSGGIAAPVAMRIVRDLLDALVAAQSLPEPLAHGEIHPQYVLVGTDGVARLSGFGVAGGLARLGNHGLKNVDRLGYAAPERVKAMASPASAASAPADARSDLFSIGVVLWELLAKQRLFPSKIEAAVIQKVLTAPIPALSSIAGVDVPAPIDELVQKLLDRDPAKRPEKAAEILATLDAATLAGEDEVKALVEKLAGKTLGAKRAELATAIKTPSVPPPRGPSAPRPRAATLLGIPTGGVLPSLADDKTRPVGTPRPAPIEEKKAEEKKADAPKPAAPKPSPSVPGRPVSAAEKASAPSIGASRPRAATLLGVMPAAPAKPEPVAEDPDDLHVDIEDPSTIEAMPEALAAASGPSKRPSPPSPKRPPAPPKPTGTPAAARAPRAPMPSAEEIEDWDTVTGLTDPGTIPAKPATPKPDTAKVDAPENAAKPDSIAIDVGAGKSAEAAASPVLDSVPPTRVQAITPNEADKPEPRGTPAKEASPPRAAEATPSKPRGVAGAQIDRIRPGITLGRYEILMPVAKGGMASVWAARIHGTRGFQKIVALKTMLPDVSDDPDFETMFLDEARVAARIRHPNVAEILDLGEQDNILYIVMEWVEGETLGKLQKAAKAVGGFPVPILLRIASQCCAGLHAAHELRDDSGNLVDLVHRDISPANVLLSTSGYVKLVDFGIAKSKARLHVTQVGGMVKGKTPYLSPEQLGGLQVDRRSDLFSLGALLYVLATGLHPFRGDTEIKTIENIALRAPIPPRQIASSLPEDFEKIVLKALEKDPANRYQTASEMQRAIDSLASSLGEPVTDDDVAAFVREVIGESQAERAAELKAAILTVDTATEAQRQPSSPSVDDKPAPSSEPEPELAADAAAASEPEPERSLSPDLDLDGDVPEISPELARRRQMLKLAVGGVIAGLAILGVLAVAMHGDDKPSATGAEQASTVVAATAAPSTTALAAPTEAPTAAVPTAEPSATAEAAPTAEPSASAVAAEASAAPSTEPAAAKTEPTAAPHKATHSSPVRTSHPPSHTGTTNSSHPPKKYNPKGI